MKVLLKRIYRGLSYTVGHLYIDGEYFCDTMEDQDRGLSDDMDVEKIKKLKVYSETAIPTGTYKLTLDVVSPRLSKSKFYQTVCNGKVPRLLNVKGFEGILIHTGNQANPDSCGCILVGVNDVKGKVTKSRDTFKKLYARLKEANDEITITIE